MYAHPLGPLADQAQALTLFCYAQDAVRNAFWQVKHGNHRVAAEQFALAAHAADILATQTAELAAGFRKDRAEYELIVERARRWSDVAFARGRFALQAAEAADREDTAVTL